MNDKNFLITEVSDNVDGKGASIKRIDEQQIISDSDLIEIEEEPCCGECQCLENKEK